jgi:hypothetical protein
VRAALATGCSSERGCAGRHFDPRNLGFYTPRSVPCLSSMVPRELAQGTPTELVVHPALSHSASGMIGAEEDLVRIR